MTAADYLRRLFGPTRPEQAALRPALARMTTPQERAPLYAAYAAARDYTRRNPGADFTDDGIIQAAVAAYETSKTGGSYLAHRSGNTAAAPGSVAVGGDLHAPVNASVTITSPNRRNVLGPWLRIVGDHTAYLARRAPAGAPAITLPREIANEIENLLIHIEGTNHTTGTNINALRRILSDAITLADRQRRA